MVNLSKKLVFVILLIAAVSGPMIVYSSTNLFTQAVRSVTPSQDLSTSCNSLVLNSSVIFASGNALFSCTASTTISATSAAFSVSGGTPTPSFNLPSGWTAVYIVNGASECPSRGTPGGLQLTSGSPESFGSSALWDYCISYSGSVGSSLPSFNIVWSQ